MAIKDTFKYPNYSKKLEKTKDDFPVLALVAASMLY